MDNSPKKTKVLFVITKSNFGGAQKYVYDLAINIPKKQYDVVVALGGTGSLIQKLQKQNIHILPVSSFTRDINTKSDLTAFFELLSIFRKEKPDVVHLNSAKAGGVGALAARIARVPKIVFTAHGWAFNEERPFWQRSVIKFFSWITVMLSHKTIAVSDAVKNDTKNWPCAGKKIVVIKNGISEPEFYTRENARNQIKAIIDTIIPENAFIIGTIAELHKNKGLSYSVEAFAKLAPNNPNLYYFVLGGGEEKARLDTLVELCGLHGRVFLVGYTEDAARFLPAFDVFILSSITEGLALVLLEAGLARLPIIASRVGGIPEIIEDNKTGLLVPPRDPDAIQNGLTRLMESPSLRTSLGTAIREKVIHDFSISNTLSATLSLYEKM